MAEHRTSCTDLGNAAQLDLNSRPQKASPEPFKTEIVTNSTRFPEIVTSDL